MRRSSLTDPPAPPRDPQRDGAIARLVAEVLERRAEGELLTDRAIIDGNPSLMPELGEELKALKRLQQAMLAAQKAGPLSDGLPPSSGTAFGSGSGSSAPPLAQRVRIQGYTVIDEIRSGGQATVFKAIQEATGKIVAIKLLHGGPLVSSRHRARFDRECEILAHLDHPNIVGILDRGQTADGSLFLVMPFIQGSSLERFLEQCPPGDPRSLKRILRLFVAIARTVQDAHSAGVIHRDLKPSNIIVDRRHQAHILDFGLARLAGGLGSGQTVTATGQIVGSVPWVSPEQVGGDQDKVDARTDVYAIGFMLYFALTGTMPWPPTSNIRKTLDQILKSPPPPPAQVTIFSPSLIKPELADIILTAMAKAPEERQPSAGVLAGELEACLAEQTLKRHAGRAVTIGKWIILGLFLTGVGVKAFFSHRHAYPAVTVIQLPSQTNSIGMRLIRIPAGSFKLGSHIAERERYENEPQHDATIARPFFMAATETTQKQYKAVMGSPPPEQPVAGDEFPVQNVLWSEAVEFCHRLSLKEGRAYRLPTEDEWEYACRAGVLGPISGTQRLDDMAWFKGNSEGKPHAVATKLPNQWGLFDMQGNVQEWCANVYTDQSLATTAPVETAQWAVLRGGGASDEWRRCRSAIRNAAYPSKRCPEGGFRVVLEATDPK